MKKDISIFSTEELEAEVSKRRNEPGIYTIISLDGYEGPSYGRIPMHIIKNKNGDLRRLHITTSDSLLVSKEPHLSDEEDGHDEAWKELEEFKNKYLIDKKIEIESFEPYLKAKII